MTQYALSLKQPRGALPVHGPQTIQVRRRGAAGVQGGGAGVFARLSRQDGKEADEEGFKNVIRAGISPNGLVSFFEKLLSEQKSQPGAVDAWFSDHPLTQDRIADIQRLIAATDPAILKTLTEDTRNFHAFKDRVHALPPGPKPKAATP